MTQELTKQKTNAAYVARYNTSDADPYAAFADEGGPGIKGKLLTCSKGDWAIGQDKTPVKDGAQFLFVVTETMRGWLKWQDGTVADADMGFVRDNFVVKHRNALGDLDEELWEKNPDGTPRDPWSRAYRALLIEMAPPHGDVTFSGSSWGAQIALKAICGAYSLDKHLYQDAFPVVQLTTKTRPNRSFGNIKGPYFDVIGWASVEDVKAGRKATSRAKAPEPGELAAALDDDIPNLI